MLPALVHAKVQDLNLNQRLKELNPYERAELVTRVLEAGMNRADTVHDLMLLYRDWRVSSKRHKEDAEAARKFFCDLRYKTPLSFARDNWQHWSAEYKLGFIKKAHKVGTDIFGCPTASVISTDIKPTAQFDNDLNELDIDTDELGVTKRDLRKIIHAVTHETWHAKQLYDVSHVPINEDTVMLRVQYEPGAYILPSESMAGYRMNPVEREAEEVSASFLSVWDSPVSWLS